MRIIYLAHPLSGNIAGNIQRAKRWYRWAVTNFEVAVIADWVITAEVLDDTNPGHRAQGIAMDVELIRVADEYWMVGGRISNGMREEEKAAYAANAKVRDLTWLGEEPPVVLPERLIAETKEFLRKAA